VTAARTLRPPLLLSTRVIVIGSSKLWHQATLALEELVQDACFNAAGNKDLIALYNELVKDQPSGSSWSGFGSRMNAVKHASVVVCICVSGWCSDVHLYAFVFMRAF